MRHDCLITSRLAGPRATCRQAAWPAHVRGLLIYCEACCGCGRAGAEAAGTDAAPGGAQSGPARGMPRKRATGRAIAPATEGKPQIPPRPFRAFLGALSGPARGILRGDLRGDAARGLPPGPRLGRPPLACPPGATTWPGRTRCHAARPWPPRPPWPRCRPGRPGRPGHDAAGPGRPACIAGPASQGQAQLPAAICGKNICASKCYGANSTDNWRFA
jgi:hypothetical protein